jgi:hypothetical protein
MGPQVWADERKESKGLYLQVVAKISLLRRFLLCGRNPNNFAITNCLRPPSFPSLLMHAPEPTLKEEKCRSFGENMDLLRGFLNIISAAEFILF